MRKSVVLQEIFNKFSTLLYSSKLGLIPFADRCFNVVLFLFTNVVTNVQFYWVG